MGRFVLIAVVGAIAFNLAIRQSSDALRADIPPATAQALAREAADAGHTLLVSAMLDPDTGELKDAADLPETFEVDGARVRLTGYDVSDNGREVEFTLVGYHGGVAHQVTSRYRVNRSDFPGPLWVASPYLSHEIDDDAEIDGHDGEAVRNSYFDASRFHAYGLGSVFSLATMQSRLSAALRAARGRGGALEVVDGMAGVTEPMAAPSLFDMK